MKKVSVWLLLSVAFITPFIFDPNVFASFVNGKVLFLRGIVFVISVLLALMLCLDKKNKDELFSKIYDMIREPIFLAISAGVVSLILSTVFAFDKYVAFFGEPLRSEGFLTLFTLFLYFVFFYIFFKEREWKIFFMLISVSSLILFVIQCYQVAIGTGPEALSGNTTFLSGYYIFSLFASAQTFIYGLKFKDIKYKLIGLVSFFAVVIGILFASTRGTMLGIFVAVVLCLLISVFTGNKEMIFKRTVRFWSIGMLIALVLFSGLFISTRQSSFWKHVPGLSRVAQFTITDSTANSRVLFAKESLTSFWGDGGAKRVLFGWGWDNYVFFWQKHYNPQVFFYDTSVADRSHNKLTDMLVMTGTVGLLAYLALWWFFISKITDRLKKDFFQGISLVFYATAYAVFLFFAFDVPTTLLGFYTVLAFIIFESYDTKA